MSAETTTTENTIADQVDVGAKDLGDARKIAQAEAREIEKILRLRPGSVGTTGGAGTAGRVTTLGSAGAGGRRSGEFQVSQEERLFRAAVQQRRREEVRAHQADLAQIRQFNRDKIRAEAEAQKERARQLRAGVQEERLQRQARTERQRDELREESLHRRAAVDRRREEQRREQREATRLEAARRQGEARRAQQARADARDAASAEGFLTTGARQGVRNFQFEQRQQAQERRAADVAARRAAADQARAESARSRQFRGEQLLSVASGRSVRIDRPLGAFGGFGGRGLPSGADIDTLTNKIRGGLTNALQRASNAAQQLNLLVGVSIFGGLGALVAEGFRLNSQLQKVNLTMAATLATTNEVVDAQGQLVDGPTKVNFLLRGTAGIYEQVRKIASETILEQQELIETVAENLALGQQAGFRLQTLGKEETGPLVETIANISQLAKAVGLPGGQRQLSQEVRALFTGERLQGATIARLLGFTSVAEIQKLQSQPGEKQGTTAFVDEINKRFARAKPILDKFKDSAEGVFTTLISQGRLFLQIFSESAFNSITGVGRELRDFLTDTRVRDTAKELGESFGKLVRSIIEVGKHLGPLLQFFNFLVRNAGTLTGLFVTFKGLQAGFGGIGAIQGLLAAGQATGVGPAASFLGAAGVGRAAGVIGGGAGAAAAAGGLSPARLAAIEFASAVPAFGLRGALQRQRALARTVLTSPISRRGIELGATGVGAGVGLRTLGLFTGATGLLGLPAAAAVVGSGLIGAGLGTLATSGAAALGRNVGQTQAVFRTPAGEIRTRPVRPTPEQVSEERALIAAQIQTARARSRALLERAGRLETNVEEGRRQPTQFSFLEKLTLRGLPVAPELTDRVGVQGPLGIATRLRERARLVVREAENEAQQLNKLRLQRVADQNNEERLQAALFQAQIRKNKEAEINLVAQLDEIGARQQIQDKTALNVKLLAIEENRVRQLRELREDERQETRESALQALGDEEGIARARAQRRRTEIARQFQGRELTPELVRLRNQQEATAALTAQRELLTARVGRLSQRAGFAGQLAGTEGRIFDQIRAAAFGDIAGAAQQRIEGRISTGEFNRFARARQIQALEEERRKRREVINEGIDLTNRFTDAVRQSTDLQRNYELGLLRLKERIRDRDFQRTKQRLQEEVNLRRATQAQIDAIVDKSLFDRTRGAQRGAFAALQAPGALTATTVGGTTFTSQTASQLSSRSLSLNQ